MKNLLHLFNAYGVELEYMIVDRESLQVKPISDELLKQELGQYGNEFVNGIVTWQNEFALHVIGLKSTRPESNFNTLENAFADDVKRINNALSCWDAMLLPTGAHPFMNPLKETKRWSRDGSEVYEIYDRIFDSNTHGWSNLQSTHLNLPFHGDEEFGKLHAAIRLILPLLPALCASSPIMDGKFSEVMDTRLVHYKTRQSRIPSFTGQVIPEPVFSQKTYEDQIYAKIKKEIGSFDKEGKLNPASINSRGAIPHFDKGYIEIRVIDIQECPAADLAIITLVIETLKSLVNEDFASLEDQKEVYMDALTGILDETIKTGSATEIFSMEYSSLFGINTFTTASEIWKHIYASLIKKGNTLLERWEPELSVIFNEGTLAERIVKATGNDASHANLLKVYRQLSECLAQDKMFIP